MIPIKILTQPDDSTCGPTSLHAVYNYLGHDISLDKLVDEVKYLKDGGTLAVLLGIDALSRGFKTVLYSYNLKIFDPTWKALSNEEIIEKMDKQLKYKQGKKFHEATEAYQKYLRSGGEITFDNLTVELLDSYFKKGIPVLTGLSATYLYQCEREYVSKSGCTVANDIKGFPAGHFVVLCGIEKDNKILVADPYKENPISKDNYYYVDKGRLLNSIMLGIMTYDANILIVENSSGNS